ncbi:hypothetical protein NIES4073_28410 [Kalymmatonema gypsitolerans NIES-4073]|nr:hypothetical protein NIES4073_28410 [Scytonema sp. NIES-4073]
MSADEKSSSYREHPLVASVWQGFQQYSQPVILKIKSFEDWSGELEIRPFRILLKAEGSIRDVLKAFCDKLVLVIDVDLMKYKLYQTL